MDAFGLFNEVGTDQCEGRLDATVDRKNIGEPHLVQSIIDRHGAHLKLDRLLKEFRHHGQTQKTMRDGALEGALAAAALDVDVQPGVVAGEFGELVDHLLRHRAALAPGAKLRRHQGVERFGVLIVDSCSLCHLPSPLNWPLSSFATGRPWQAERQK